LYSNLVNNYKSSYNNNYNNIDNYLDNQKEHSSYIVNKEYKVNDGNNKNNIQYQHYKNNNKYNDYEKVKRDFIKNIINNISNEIIYVVWTDNTYGNSEILFSSSIDNGNSFSSPINISNNIGESIQLQIITP
jgi:hypothetical protein